MPSKVSKNRREEVATIKQQVKNAERRRTAMFVGAITLVVAILGALLVIGIRNASSGGGSASATDLKSVSGLGETSLPPWPLPSDTAARAAAAGLPIGPMNMTYHYHVHVDILIDGKAVPVPQNLGIDSQTGAIAGVHTHSNDGLIHIEAGQKGQPFTLGQLFTIWNVRLTADQLGSLVASDGKTLGTYVNGKEYAGNPALLRLARNQQIALVLGDANARPEIPSTYDFGTGL